MGANTSIYAGDFLYLTLFFIIGGWLADRPEVNAILINNIALTMCGIVTVVAPLLNSFYLFVGYSLLFGLCIGEI